MYKRASRFMQSTARAGTDKHTRGVSWVMKPTGQQERPTSKTKRELKRERKALAVSQRAELKRERKARAASRKASAPVTPKAQGTQGGKRPRTLSWRFDTIERSPFATNTHNQGPSQ